MAGRILAVASGIAAVTSVFKAEGSYEACQRADKATTPQVLEILAQGIPSISRSKISALAPLPRDVESLTGSQSTRLCSAINTARLVAGLSVYLTSRESKERQTLEPFIVAVDEARGKAKEEMEPEEMPERPLTLAELPRRALVRLESLNFEAELEKTKRDASKLGAMIREMEETFV